MPILLTPHGSQEIGSFWEQFAEICSLSAPFSWGALTEGLAITSNEPSPDVCSDSAPTLSSTYEMDLTRWIICGYNIITLRNVEFPIIARQAKYSVGEGMPRFIHWINNNNQKGNMLCRFPLLKLQMVPCCFNSSSLWYRLCYTH